MLESDLDIRQATDAQKKRALTFAVEVRKSEIDRFWSRTLIFWGFIAATFVAFGALYKESQTDFLPLLTVSCFGFISSFAWTLQNRGSKYWQEAWEKKVEILESDVLKISLFANREILQRKGVWGAGRWSVSKLVTAMSDLAVLTWFLLGIHTYSKANPDFFTKLLGSRLVDLPSIPTALILFSIFYATILLTLVRRKD